MILHGQKYKVPVFGPLVGGKYIKCFSHHFNLFVIVGDYEAVIYLLGRIHVFLVVRLCRYILQLNSFENAVGFYGDDDHYGNQQDNLDIDIDKEEEADALVDVEEEGGSEYHEDPAEDVDYWEEEFEFGEAFEIIDVHV